MERYQIAAISAANVARDLGGLKLSRDVQSDDDGETEIFEGWRHPTRIFEEYHDNAVVQGLVTAGFLRIENNQALPTDEGTAALVDARKALKANRHHIQDGSGTFVDKAGKTVQFVDKGVQKYVAMRHNNKKRIAYCKKILKKHDKDSN